MEILLVQSARDRYRDLAAVGGGMNWDLVQKFIRVCPYMLLGEQHLT